MTRVRTINSTDSVEDGRIRWKNFGGGRLSLRDGRKIVPGEIFRAYPYEISDGFRDVIKPLDAVVPKLEEPPANLVKPIYTLKHRGGGKYNILDFKGKIVNATSLSKVDAEAFIKSLEE